MATNTYINIDLPETVPLADLMGIRVDLLSARELAALLKETYKANQNEKLKLIEALSIAVLIKYSRPFARSGGVRMRLGEDALNVFTGPQQKEHSRILEIRNKYVAHSVNEFEDSQPVARYWKERVHSEGITSIEVVHTRVTGLSSTDADSIIELTDKLLGYVDSRLQAEKTKVLEMIRQIPIDDLLRKFRTRSAHIDVRNPDKRRSGPGRGDLGTAR